MAPSGKKTPKLAKIAVSQRLTNPAPALAEAQPQPENYILEVVLDPLKFKKASEKIIRIVSVLAIATFTQLHKIIEAAFEWQTLPSWSSWNFTVKDCEKWTS